MHFKLSLYIIQALIIFRIQVSTQTLDFYINPNNDSSIQNGSISNPYLYIESVFLNNLTNLSNNQIINIYLLEDNAIYIFPNQIIPNSNSNITITLQSYQFSQNLDSEFENLVCEVLPQVIFEDTLYQNFVQSFTFAWINIIYNVTSQNTNCTFQSNFSNSIYQLNSACINIQNMNYASFFCGISSGLIIQNVQFQFPSNISFNNFANSSFPFINIQSSVNIENTIINCYDAINFISVQNTTNITLTNITANCFTFNEFNNIQNVNISEFLMIYDYENLNQVDFDYAILINAAAIILVNNIIINNSNSNQFSILKIVDFISYVNLDTIIFNNNTATSVQFLDNSIVIESSIVSIFDNLNISNIYFVDNNLNSNITSQNQIEVWFISIQDYYNYDNSNISFNFEVNYITNINYSNSTLPLNLLNYTAFFPSINFKNGLWILNNITIENIDLSYIALTSSNPSLITIYSTNMWNITNLTISNLNCSSIISQQNTQILQFISFNYLEVVNIQGIIVENNIIQYPTYFITLSSGSLSLNNGLFNENSMINTIFLQLSYISTFNITNLDIINSSFTNSTLILIQNGQISQIPPQYNNYLYNIENMQAINITLINYSYVVSHNSFGCFSISNSLFSEINLLSSSIGFVNTLLFFNTTPNCSNVINLNKIFNTDITYASQSLLAVYSNNFTKIYSENSQIYNANFVFVDFFGMIIINNTFSSSNYSTNNDIIFFTQRIISTCIYNNFTDLVGSGLIFSFARSEIWQISYNTMANTNGISFLSLSDNSGSNNIMNDNIFENITTNINQRFIVIEGPLPIEIFIFDSNRFYNITALNQILMFEITSSFTTITNCNFTQINIDFTQFMTIISWKTQIANSTFVNVQGSSTIGYLYIGCGDGVYVISSIFTNNDKTIGAPFFFLINIAFDNSSTTSKFNATNITVINNLFFFASASLPSLTFLILDSKFIYSATNQTNRLISSILSFSGCGIQQFTFSNNEIEISQTWSIPDIIFAEFLLLESFNIKNNSEIDEEQGQIYNTSILLMENLNIFSNSNESFLFLFGYQIQSTILFADNIIITGSGVRFLLIDSGEYFLSNINIYNLQMVTPLIILECNLNYQSINNDLTMTIKNSNFANIVFTPIDSITGVIFISQDGTSNSCEINATIINTNFTYIFSNSTSYNSSAVIIDYNGPYDLNIENSVFSGCISNSGPAICILTNTNLISAYNNIVIQQCIFINNSAYLDGGAIYSTQNILILENSVFEKDSAYTGSGGAIYLCYPINASILNNIINSNTFFENIRYVQHDAYSELNDISTITVNFSVKCIFNPGGSYIDYQYYEGLIINNDNYTISNASTDTLQYLIWNLTLLDSLGNYILNSFGQNQTLIQITIKGNTFNSQDCTEYFCLIAPIHFKLNGIAGEMIPINITYILYSLTLTTQTFYILLRDCLVGEIVLMLNPPAYECYICQNQTYSLVTDFSTIYQMQCLPCPNNYATCPGGSILNVSAGYWRSNLDSDNILPCRYEMACLGGYNSSCSQGYVCCVEGYLGPLCESCDSENNYVRSSPNKCSLCVNNDLIYESIIYMIGILFYNFMYSNMAISSEKLILAKINPEMIQKGMAQNIYMRLLTTYSQIILIVINLLNIPEYYIEHIRPIFGFAGNPTQILYFSSRCFALAYGNSENLYLINIVFTSFSPLLFIILISLFRIITWKFRLDRSKLYIIGNTAMCIATISQPSTVLLLLQYLQCTTLSSDNDINYYVYSEMGYQCYTSIYWSFFYAYVLPNLIIWLIVFPAAIFYVIFKKRHDLKDHVLRLTMGSILNGYNEKAYYWGFLVMILKLCIITISTLLYNDAKTNGLSIFVILYIYYYFFKKSAPYEQEEANRVEELMFLCFMVTIFLSIYIQDNERIKLVLTAIIIIVGINILAVGTLMSHLIKIYLEKIKSIKNSQTNPHSKNLEMPLKVPKNSQILQK